MDILDRIVAIGVITSYWVPSTRHRDKVHILILLYDSLFQGEYQELEIVVSAFKGF
jgi:hypothetical protein